MDLNVKKKLFFLFFLLSVNKLEHQSISKCITARYGLKIERLGSEGLRFISLGLYYVVAPSETKLDLV